MNCLWGVSGRFHWIFLLFINSYKQDSYKKSYLLRLLFPIRLFTTDLSVAANALLIIMNIGSKEEKPDIDEWTFVNKRRHFTVADKIGWNKTSRWKLLFYVRFQMPFSDFEILQQMFGSKMRWRNTNSYSLFSSPAFIRLAVTLRYLPVRIPLEKFQY